MTISINDIARCIIENYEIDSIESIDFAIDEFLDDDPSFYIDASNDEIESMIEENDIHSLIASMKNIQ